MTSTAHKLVNINFSSNRPDSTTSSNTSNSIKKKILLDPIKNNSSKKLTSTILNNDKSIMSCNTIKKNKLLDNKVDLNKLSNKLINKNLSDSINTNNALSNPTKRLLNNCKTNIKKESSINNKYKLIENNAYDNITNKPLSLNKLLNLDKRNNKTNADSMLDDSNSKDFFFLNQGPVVTNIKVKKQLHAEKMFDNYVNNQINEDYKLIIKFLNSIDLREYADIFIKHGINKPELILGNNIVL